MNQPVGKPVLQVNGKAMTQKVYMLNPGESFSQGKLRFTARKTASLIYECNGPEIGYRVEECDLRDSKTWVWIQALVDAGTKKTK
jgi:hypothetical protein